MSAKKKGPAACTCGTPMNTAPCENHRGNVPHSAHPGKNAYGSGIRFAWQKCIRNSDLPKMTRAVLQTLSTYMDQDGKCFPSQTTLAADTGTSKRTIVKHIGYAEHAGWLKKDNVKSKRGTWGHNIYYATLPAKLDQRHESGCNQVNSVHEPGASGSASRVYEMHSNTPPNKHLNNGVKSWSDELFELAWDNFPRNPKSSYDRALAEWYLLTYAEQEQCATAAVKFSLQFNRCQVEGHSAINDKLQYVSHLSTWLARREWAL